MKSPRMLRKLEQFLLRPRCLQAQHWLSFRPLRHWTVRPEFLPPPGLVRLGLAYRWEEHRHPENLQRYRPKQAHHLLHWRFRLRHRPRPRLQRAGFLRRRPEVPNGRRFHRGTDSRCARQSAQRLSVAKHLNHLLGCYLQRHLLERLDWGRPPRVPARYRPRLHNCFDHLKNYSVLTRSLRRTPPQSRLAQEQTTK